MAFFSTLNISIGILCNIITTSQPIFFASFPLVYIANSAVLSCSAAQCTALRWPLDTSTANQMTRLGTKHEEKRKEKPDLSVQKVGELHEFPRARESMRP